MPSQQVTKHTDDTLSSSWITPITIRSQDYFAKTLPPKDAKSEELIAVNKNGDRIDSYFPMPQRDIWEAYTRRARQHKICNKYHLGGECGDMSCEYDHSDVDAGILHVMFYILRQTPCPRSGKCRSIKCYTGHHCQRDSCRGGKGCKFGKRGHTVDIHLAEWVTPIDTIELDNRLSSISDESLETNSYTDGIVW